MDTPLPSLSSWSSFALVTVGRSTISPESSHSILCSLSLVSLGRIVGSKPPTLFSVSSPAASALCLYLFSRRWREGPSQIVCIYARPSTGGHACQNIVVGVGLSFKCGLIMGCADGKMVGGSGEYFVGCADLIETYHYPLAFSRPLPQVPCFPPSSSPYTVFPFAHPTRCLASSFVAPVPQFPPTSFRAHPAAFSFLFSSSLDKILLTHSSLLPFLFLLFEFV